MISANIKRFCKDFTKIENYEKAMQDEEFIWHCHHRLEEQGFKPKELKEKGLYYNREPEELIFLHPIEHFKLHSLSCNEKSLNRYKCDREFSKETRAKMSASHKGKKHSEETRIKISQNNAKYWKCKKRSEEQRARMSAAMKGKKRSAETRARMSAAIKACWQRRKLAKQQSQKI